MTQLKEPGREIPIEKADVVIAGGRCEVATAVAHGAMEDSSGPLLINDRRERPEFRTRLEQILKK